MRALALVLSGCGRIAFDPATAGDGDAAVDAAPCTEPFGAPVEIVTGLAETKSPTVTADELELVVNDLDDLYVLRRATRDDPWNPAVLLGVASRCE